MAPTAVTPEELPWRGGDTAACSAARAGRATMSLPGLPGSFDVEFVGTGIASMPATAVEGVFNPASDVSRVDMVWNETTFVGSHRILGDFRIDLADDIPSTGVIESVGSLEFGAQTVNTNDFFFDFQFRRFPFANMANTTPIRNRAVVSGVPPVGSVFTLAREEADVYEFARGPMRTMNRTESARQRIQFNQCDVTVYPERNVALELRERSREDNRHKVTVSVENTSAVTATFAYFSVIHYKGISTDSDYGFVLLQPGESRDINYTVESSIPGRTLDIPFFAALYLPSAHGGVDSLELEFEF